MNNENSEQFMIQKEARWRHSLTTTGIVCIVFILLVLISIIIFVPDAKKLNEDLLMEAKKQQYALQLPIGVTLLAEKDQLSALNFTVIHTFKQDLSKVYIWDIGDVDGDYVQLFADGVPITEPFILRHKPRAYNIPTNTVIEVRGIHDVEQEGIHYGIMFTVNEISYFNYVQEHKSNKYQLKLND